MAVPGHVVLMRNTRSINRAALDLTSSCLTPSAGQLLSVDPVEHTSLNALKQSC